jgi:hypothetical protein
MRAQLLKRTGDSLTIQPLRIVGERNHDGQRTLILTADGPAHPADTIEGRAADEGHEGDGAGAARGRRQAL